MNIGAGERPGSRRPLGHAGAARQGLNGLEAVDPWGTRVRLVKV